MKGQGLPLSFIVIAAISALVLILVVAFTVGGLGGFFKQITIVGGGEELSAVQTACSTACTNAQTTATTLDAFKRSDYCRRTFAVDLNKDGKTDKAETGLKCWSDKITVGNQRDLTGAAVPCTLAIGDKAYEVKAGDKADACTKLA